MRNLKYDIVFEGRFVEGAEPKHVRVLLSQIFKISPEDAVRFFSGRCIVIKKGVDLPEAHRFKTLLRKAGAACRLVPQNAPLSGHPDLSLIDREAALKPTADTGTNRDGATSEAPTDAPVKSNARSQRMPSEAPPAHLPNGPLRRRSAMGMAHERKGMRSFRSNRRLQLLLGALALIGVVSMAALWHEVGPMPADTTTMEAFVTGFENRLRQVKTGRARAVTHVNVARAVIEDMGYDYDKTLLYWCFNQIQAQPPRRRAIRNDYLIGPLKILYELDANRMRSGMAPETYAALESTLGIGEHITLRSIRMLRACARNATLIRHEALVDGLQKFDITVDADYPEISIEEAFYGLHHNGLIQIETRREWKVKRVELKILDRAQIARQEKKLQQQERLYAHYTQRP